MELVAGALAKAGAGIIGNYDSCSFRSQGTGTFRANRKANPKVGRKDHLEHVLEVRLEMVVEGPNVRDVINSLKATHPYEEPAYDVYPIENSSKGYGMGVIGYLERSMSVPQFILHTKRTLKVQALRHTPFPAGKIRSVAVCGGSGSELAAEAMRQGADAFVTADIKYHNFHDARGRILLVDAGHYETERPVVDVLVRRLNDSFRQSSMKVPIFAARTSTNPIVYN